MAVVGMVGEAGKGRRVPSRCVACCYHQPPNVPHHLQARGVWWQGEGEVVHRCGWASDGVCCPMCGWALFSVLTLGTMGMPAGKTAEGTQGSVQCACLAAHQIVASYCNNCAWCFAKVMRGWC